LQGCFPWQQRGDGSDRPGEGLGWDLGAVFGGEFFISEDGNHWESNSENLGESWNLTVQNHSKSPFISLEL